MKKYIALLRRADFTDLYKYGSLYLNKDLITELDCDIKELSSRDDIFDQLFSKLNPFESSFTYLLISYMKKDEETDYHDVSVEEIQHVFPLDIEAKKEFENTFDEHIKIDFPIWNDAIPLIQKKLLYNSSIQGIHNVFNIFKLDGLKNCKTIIDDDTIEDMLSDVYDNIPLSGDKSIWVYLMRYERHSYYPKDIVGYYMDIVHIVCNYMVKREITDNEVENTEIYNILQEGNYHNKKTCDINLLLNRDRRASAFLAKIKELVPQIDFLNTAVCYLKLRDQFSEKFSYDSKFIDGCKKSFGECFTLASYMIGITLSHDKTYTCLYENLPLAFYKSKEEIQALYEQKEQERIRARHEMEQMELKRKEEKERHKSKGNKGGQKSYKGYGNNAYNPQQDKWGKGTGAQHSFPPTSNPENFDMVQETQEATIGKHITYPCTLIEYSKKTGKKLQGKKVINNSDELHKFKNTKKYKENNWKLEE